MNPADLEGLRQAVLGAQNTPAPPSSLGASQAPELAQLYATDFQLPASTIASGALAQGTGDLLKAQASSGGGSGGSSGGRKAAAGGYTVKPRKDGGFGFYDPNGNEISVSEYAAATGKKVQSVLKDSRNPIDIQFLRDHKQLDQYIKDKAISKTDPKARSRAQSVETQVRSLYGIKMHQQTIDEVVNAFYKAYPTIYGAGSNNAQGITTGFGDQAGKQGTRRLIPGTGSQKKASPYGSLGAGRL